MDNNSDFYNLNISGDSILLESLCFGRNSKAVYFPLVIAIITILLPLSAFLWLILYAEDNNLSFGFFLVILLFASIFVYFFRLYLWNKYGKEVFIIRKGKLIHYYDYKLFKDNYKEQDSETIEMCCVVDNELTDISDVEESKFYPIGISVNNGSEFIISRQELPAILIKKLNLAVKKLQK